MGIPHILEHGHANKSASWWSSVYTQDSSVGVSRLVARKVAAHLGVRR